MLRQRILPCLLVLAVIACSGEEPSTGGDAPVATHVDTLGGIPHVVNSGTPGTWRLEEMMRLGSSASLAEPKPDEFGGVSSASLGPDGRVYVADWLNYEVRVFSETGEFQFSFGRDGEGPGEFGALYSLAWVGDTLLTLDFGVGRVGMFSPEGEWLGQYRLPGSVSGSGRLLRFYQTAPAEAYAWSLENTGSGLENVFIRYTLDGPEDTIPEFDVDPRPESTVICRHPEGSIHFWEIPFSPRVLQHPLQDRRRAVAISDDYRIAVIDESGDTLRVVERRQDPIPASDEAWETGLDEYNEFRAENPSASCEPRSLSKPALVPPIADLLSDPDGRLWVQAETPEGRYWEVFDRGGAILGRVPDFPRGERTVPQFRGNRIVNVAADSLGVDHVHLYRIIVPPDGNDRSG